MRIIGLDFRLIDVSEIKGITECTVNFEFGSFESCSYNCSNNQSGGLMSVSILDDDVDIQSLLCGSLTITVISRKKLFDVLCDGSCFVDMNNIHDSSQPSPFGSLFPMNFDTLRSGKVKLNMLYRNKGHTRIKAGTVEIMISIVDLSDLSHEPLESHVHCKLNVNSDEEVTNEVATNTSVDANTGRDCNQCSSADDRSYSVSGSSNGSDGDYDDEDDDDSIDVFMSRFDSSVKVQEVDSTGHEMSRSVTAPTQLEPTVSTKRKVKLSKTKANKYWYTSLKIADIPLPPAQPKTSSLRRPSTGMPTTAAATQSVTKVVSKVTKPTPHVVATKSALSTRKMSGSVWR